MTTTLNRGISFLLVLCMVIGALPMIAREAEAASNIVGTFEGQDSDIFTALGFDTSVLPEGYDAETTENPTGKEKSVGNQVFELILTSQRGTEIYGVNDNTLNGSTFEGVPETDGSHFYMSAVAAADFDGDGLPGELVYVGFRDIEYIGDGSQDGSELYIAFADAEGGELSYGPTRSVAERITPYYTASSMKNYEMYDWAWQNLLQVTAGDYDGDGMAEIAFYVAEEGHGRVDVYKYQKTSQSPENEWLDSSAWSRVWSHALSGPGRPVPNMVSLATGDLNRDGVDDLAISSGRAIFEMTEGLTGDVQSVEVDASAATVLWGAKSGMLQTRSALDLNEAELGAQARVSLITGDLDGDGYRELIATGQSADELRKYTGTVGEKIEAGNKTRTVTTYIYDSENGLVKNTSNTFSPIDGEFVTADIDGETRTSWKGNGFDNIYYSLPIMRTNAAVFAPEGFDYRYLYLDSCMYECVEGQLQLKYALDDKKYDGEVTLGGDAKWARADLLSQDYIPKRGMYAEYGAASEDVKGRGNSVLAIGSYSNMSYATKSTNTVMGNTVTRYDNHHSGGYSVLYGVDGVLHSQVTTRDHSGAGGLDVPSFYPVYADLDIDTTLIEYTGIHYLTYSDPKVLAIIAAAPYFEDVDKITGYDYAWQNTTSYSQVNGEGKGKTVSMDLEYGDYFTTSITGGGGNAQLEGSINFTLEWTEETVNTTEYTLTFETSQDEDAVAFFSIPTENYIYRVSVPDGNGGYNVTDETVSRTFTPCYQVLDLDYYESIRRNYKSLPAIKGNVIHSTPGDPASYPASSKGYDVIKEWNDHAAGVSFGNGSITQEIAVTKEESDSFNLGTALDFKFGGGVELQSDLGQAKVEIGAGAQFSLNPSGGWADIDITGSVFSGTVANMPEMFRDYGYYYSWKLFAYNYKLDKDTKIPVVSYIVGDVSEPPKLPDDFEQDVERTTHDKNVLTWTYDGTFTNFLIYRYFDFPVGGGLQLVKTIPSSTADYKVLYDENGKPYKEYFFEDTNLSPYAEYEYSIQVERLSQTPPLSAPSALYTARTKARDGYPMIPISESDGEDDKTLLVYPDKNAYLTVNATGPDGEAKDSYYSTVQYQWQKKEREAWENITGEESMTLTFAAAGVEIEGEYRCLVNVLTKEDNVAISTYTDPVTVTHSKRTAYFSELYAGDLNGGVELFAKVSNAHSDSGTVPSGIVTFTVTDNATGKEYQTFGELSEEGIALKVITAPLPEGMYTVEAVYSGSFIFTSADDYAYHLSQREEGYVVDAPSQVTFGDGAEITFLKATKEDGRTVTEETNATFAVLYYAIKLQRKPIPGAKEVTYGDYVGSSAASITLSDGTKAYFKQEDTLFTEYIGSFGDYAVSIVPSFTEFLYPGSALGKYELSEKASAQGIYLVLMVSETGQYVYNTVDVVKRDLTLQLPRMNGAEGTSPDPVIMGELEVAAGSYAPFHLEEGTFDSLELALTYTNTAGTVFTKENATNTCGYYVLGMDSSRKYDFENSYNIIFRPGSLAVLGAMHDVTVGAREFEGLPVGTLYTVFPEYESTRDALVQQHQTGTRMVFTAVPDDGYEVYDWYINGKAQGNSSTSIAYVLLNEDTTVEVQFAIKRNSLTFGTAGDEGGGSIVCTDGELTSGSYIIANSRFRFEAKANEGYHFKEWRYSEIGTGTVYHTEDNGKDDSFFELLMPRTSVTLYAVFERDFYTFDYEDPSEFDGLTAWYLGTSTTDTTAPVEKQYISPGDKVKGDTVITVEAAPGYEFDLGYRYVSEGSEGTADYTEGTYTLTLKEDTKVTGYTYRKYHYVAVDYNITSKSSQPVGAGAEYIYEGEEGSYIYTEDTPRLSLENIPGGVDVEVKVTYPGYYDLKGWVDKNSAVIASRTQDPLAKLINFGDPVEADGVYRYLSETDLGIYEFYFTSPYDGIAEWSGENVTVYRSGDTYEFEKLDADETVTVHLVEKDLFKVNLADITGDGVYIYASEGGEIALPEGAFLENVKEEDGYVTAADVTVHRGDTLTLMVNCEDGRTVSYWQATPETGETRLTRAGALKYTIPAITENFEFSPIFSSSTYNTVNWSTISEYQNNVTLSPESGYIASVASGNDFRFKLVGGGRAMIESVFGNGVKFTEGGNTKDGHNYRIENGVYIIENINANQTVTVKMREVGVKVDGVDVSEGSGNGWKYNHVTQTLDITRSGLTLSGNNRGDFDATYFNIVTGTSVAGLTLKDLKIDLDRSDNPVLTVKSGEMLLAVEGNVRLDGDNDYDDYISPVIKTNGNLIITGDGFMEVFRWVGPDYVDLARPMINVVGELSVINEVELKLRSEANNNVLSGFSNSADTSVKTSNSAISATALYIGQENAQSFPTVTVTADGRGASAFEGESITVYGGNFSATTVGGKPTLAASEINNYDGIMNLKSNYTTSSSSGGSVVPTNARWNSFYTFGYAVSSTKSSDGKPILDSRAVSSYSGQNDSVRDFLKTNNTSYKAVSLMSAASSDSEDGLTVTFVDTFHQYSGSIKIPDSFYSNENGTFLYVRPYSLDITTEYNSGYYRAAYIYEGNISFDGLNLSQMYADIHISGVNLDCDITVSGKFEQSIVLDNAAVKSISFLAPYGASIGVIGESYIVNDSGVPLDLDDDKTVQLFTPDEGGGKLSIISGDTSCIRADELRVNNLVELSLYSGYGTDGKALDAVEAVTEGTDPVVRYYEAILATSNTGDDYAELPYGTGWSMEYGTGFGESKTACDSAVLNKSGNYLRLCFENREPKYDRGFVYNKDSLEESQLIVNYTDPIIDGLIYQANSLYKKSVEKEDIARAHLICPDGTEIAFLPWLETFTDSLGSVANDFTTTVNLGRDFKIMNNHNSPGYYETEFAGMTPLEALDTLPNGEYIFRVYFFTFNRTPLSERMHFDIPLVITDNRGSITMIPDDVLFANPGENIRIETQYNGKDEVFYDWSLTGGTDSATVLNSDGTSASLNIGAEANGCELTVAVRAYMDEEMTDLAAEKSMTLTVITPAVSIEVMSDGQSGDSFILERNIESGESATIQLTPVITLSDGTAVDVAEWTLWGNVRADTTVDESGLLTVSPKETGTGAVLKATATYTALDGTVTSKTVTVSLKSGSKVSYTAEAEGGSITGAACGGAELSAEGTWIPAGESVTVTASPNEHYKVKAWYINGKQTEGNGNTMTFTTEEMGRYNVSVEFEKITYTVTLEIGANGAVSVDGTEYTSVTELTFESGSEITVLPIPNEGYIVKNATVQGTFTVNSDAVISAEFDTEPEAPVYYTVRINSKGEGDITVTTAAGTPVASGDKLLAGTAVILVPRPSEGFLPATVSVNGFVMISETYVVNGDTEITFSFAQMPVPEVPEPVYYTVTNSVEGVGDITIDTEDGIVANGDSVLEGTVLTIGSTPAEGYLPAKISVNGFLLVGDTYTVTGDTDIKFLFEQEPEEDLPEPVYYTVTYDITGEGDVEILADNESIPENVCNGAVLTVDATPAEGYVLKSIAVNGLAYSGEGYIVTTDTHVTVVFEEAEETPYPEPEKYTVTTGIIGEGTVTLTSNGETVADGSEVLPGTKLTVNATPAEGYLFKTVTVNGLLLEGDVYTVNTDSVIEVTFERKPEPVTYAVCLEVMGEGEVILTADGEIIENGAKVAAGTLIAVTATPADGAKLVSLTIGGTEHESGEGYRVYAATKIEVVFDNSGASGGLPYYLDEEGNKVFIGLAFDVNGNGIIDEGEYIAPEGVQVLFTENDKEFDDIDRHWGEESILFVAERELFLGTGNGIFDTEAPISRAMFVTVLGRLYERSFGAIEEVEAGTFTDCDYTAYYGKYVDWAQKNGIINGYGNGLFGPDDLITREQMAVLLYNFARFMGKLPASLDTTLDYTDSDEIAGWAIEGVRFCQTTGLIEGMTGGEFAPSQNAKRVEMAVVAIRLIEYLLK